MFGITDYTQKIVDYGKFEFSMLTDALGFGGAMLLIGMATIFSVLIIIWLSLVLFKLFFHDLPAKKAAKTAVVAETAAPVETVQVVNNNDEEIVAVIAAAIAMAESESSDIKFKVVSFRKK